jgi:hypothetical protein
VAENLRSTERMLGPAVRSTIDALELEAVDDAAVRLAIRYADVIDAAGDQAWAMRWIGPELLSCLSALGATPAARAAIKGVAPAAPQRVSGLTALRAAHKTA